MLFFPPSIFALCIVHDFSLDVNCKLKPNFMKNEVNLAHTKISVLILCVIHVSICLMMSLKLVSDS